MAGPIDIKQITDLLNDKTKGIFDKINKVSDTVDKLAGGVGTALKSNIQFKEVAKAIEEVDVAAHKTVAIFGQGREHILAIKANLVDSVQAVTKLGGSFDAIAQMQNDITSSLGRNLIVNSNIYEKLFATTTVTGIGADKLTTAFKDIGMSVSHISSQMQKVSDVSRGLGVNTSAVSSQVVSNIEYMNRFNFQGGVEGMAKMAAQAVGLRVSMKDTLQFAERVYNPESAIETAAALQRLGVTQSELLDPLRLMDLSLNDPAELQNQIAQMTQQFVQMGKAGSFEILPEGKLQLYEIAKAMNMPYETLTKFALGTAELEEKMKRMRFPSGEEFADEKTRNLIANMAEWDEATGEYKISFTDKDGQAQTKSVTKLEPEDIKALEEASKPKDMTKLAEEQLDTQKSIVQAVKSLEKVVGFGYAASPMTQKALDAQVEIYRTAIGNISDKFSTKGFREVFTKTGNEVLKEIKKADGDVTKIDAGVIKEQIKTIKDYLVDLGSETVTTGLKNTTEAFKKSANEFVEFLGKADLNLEKIAEKLKEIFGEDGEGGGNQLDPCYGVNCDPGQICNNGNCIPDPDRITTVNPCDGVNCDPGQICNNGNCIPDPGRTIPMDIESTNDLVSYPNSGGRVLTGEFGAFSLDKRDMIIAGDPNKLLGQSDNEIFGFMEHMLLNQQSSSTNGNIKIDGNPKITLDINVNSPQNISKDEMMTYLQDKGVAGMIYEQIQELLSNNNRTIDYTNPTEKNKKLTNDQYNSMR